MKKVLLVLLVLVSTTNYAQDLSHVELPKELQFVLDNYEKHWTAFDAASLASLFTEDGFILRPGHDPVKGKAEIEKAYEGAGGNLYLWAYDYSVEGDTGFIIGGYSGKEGMKPWGKFTLTLKRVEGKWMIHSDMDNGNKGD